MKKWLLISVFVVMIISFGGTFYIQHQAFSEQKLTMKSNFNKKENKSNQQIKDLRDKNSELEKTIKANQDKTNALQTELDSLKAEKEQTVATNQEVTETPTEQSNEAPVSVTQQEETVAPATETPKEKTNAAGQTYQERGDELKKKVDSGELKPRELFDILDSEFP